MMVNIYYQNVRGLRTKTVQFKRNILLNNYDIVLLTETWLLDGIGDGELFNDAYTVWRRDRDYSSLGQARGGGVLIAVRSDLAAHARPEWHSTAEDVWVSLRIGAKGKNPPINLNIGCIYLCHQNQGLSFTTQLSNFSDKVLTAFTSNPHDKFLIAGDFNLSDIAWSSVSDVSYLSPVFQNNNPNHSEIQDLMNLYDLCQFNSIKNHHDGILDLIFSNDEIMVSHCINPLVGEDSYHPALLCQPNFFELPQLKSQSRLKYFYNKGDYAALSSDLDKLDWDNLLSCGTVDEAVTLFNNLLSSLRDKHVPHKSTLPNRYPVWYSPALKQILKEKNKVHRRIKTYGNRADYLTFNILRQRVKRVEEECYQNYIINTENFIHKNPKAFWSYFHASKQNSSYPSTMMLNGSTLSSGHDICNAFAEFFSSNFLNSSNSNVNNSVPINLNSLEEPYAATDISSIEIKHDQVHKLINTLDCNKSAGPDGLHPVLISSCARSLCSPVTYLFNRSIREGVVPRIWKSANVTPIHKKGSKRDVTNYRPISKLSVLAKVLEKIVHQQVYAALKHTFIPQQHGFMKGRSTCSNLVTFTDEVSFGMQRGGQVDTIYTDYTKAFDRIDHKILLRKLYFAGIHGNLLRWFSSYITDRCQTVVLNGFCSQSRFSTIPSGVPQGSILGPLLFTLFINDIHTCFSHSHYLLFADDMKVYRKVDTIHDCLLLQQDLDRLYDYCTINKLDLNISKCNCISFSRAKHPLQFNYTINQQPLQRTDHTRDLGVILDSKLLLDKHIETITAKATKTLGFVIRSTKHFTTVKTLKILYCSLVRSQLEYACQVWNPQYEIYINKIEKIQKKFLRFVNYKHKINSHPDYFNNCKHHHLLPLVLRREAADLTFLHNLTNGRVDCSELLSHIKIQIPTRINSRRGYIKLHEEVCLTNYRLNSFFNRTFHDFNKNYSADSDLFTAKPNFFKRSINIKFFEG